MSRCISCTSAASTCRSKYGRLLISSWNTCPGFRCPNLPQPSNPCLTPGDRCFGAPDPAAPSKTVTTFHLVKRCIYASRVVLFPCSSYSQLIDGRLVAWQTTCVIHLI